MKQRNIPKVGAFVESLFTCLPFLGIINFMILAVVLYTNIQPYLLTHMPWMNLWIFLILVLMLVATMMVLIYKFVLPSIWTFRGKQMFGHKSDVIDELKAIKKRLENIEGKVLNK